MPPALGNQDGLTWRKHRCHRPAGKRHVQLKDQMLEVAVCFTLLLAFPRNTIIACKQCYKPQVKLHRSST